MESQQQVSISFQKVLLKQENKEDQVAALYGAGKQGAKAKPAGKKKAEKFLKEDHSDTNMLVAIRIRPLNQKEISNNEMDIIRSEDKLLVSSKF